MIAPPQPIPAARYRDRLTASREALRAAGARALLVGPGAELRWLVGYAAPALERLTMLVLPLDEPPVLIVPRLERAGGAAAPAVAAGDVDLRSWEETDDPYAIVASALGTGSGAGSRAAGGSGSGSGSGVGLDRRLLVGDRLWATFVLGLQSTVPGASFGLASSVLADLRSIKDADEIRLLTEAAEAADRTVQAIAAGRLVGRTEGDIGREVRDRLLAEGHETAAFSIVGSGPNSAEPHHAVSERVVGPGEPIVLDIGGTRGGYGSDTTRTLWVTGGDPGAGPDDTFRQLYAVLEAAQAAATAAARAGVTCEAVDAAAREPITAAGFGPAFLHRTGHGIGLEEHEEPYIVAGNAQPLAVGHAFSIEPGIYLEGRYGARIEDIVVCTAEGPVSLNRSPRDVLVVSGV
ncbi:MAG TPA: Xaa-Pro peptidase family protein [Candidatus Limnocylindrales bacterium]|nr:Xaa-Pro peptidase family protein [Candidatus Limnocylindrales bacterium]